MITAITNIANSKNKRELDRAVFNACKIAGCDYFSYLPALPCLPENKVVSNFPTAWKNHYTNKRLYTVDMTFDIANNDGRCFYLSDLEKWITATRLENTHALQAMKSMIDYFKDNVSREAIFIPTGRSVEKVPVVCCAAASVLTSATITKIKAMAYVVHIVVERALSAEMGLANELIYANVYRLIGAGLSRDKIIDELRIPRRRLNDIIAMLIERYQVKNHDELMLFSAENAAFTRRLIDSIKSEQLRDN